MRNASTRVADKVGWPVNWWPTLDCLTALVVNVKFIIPTYFAQPSPVCKNLNLFTLCSPVHLIPYAAGEVCADPVDVH
jgi:hypothetical protein